MKIGVVKHLIRATMTSLADEFQTKASNIGTCELVSGSGGLQSTATATK